MQWTTYLTETQDYYSGYRELTIHSPVVTQEIQTKSPLEGYLSIPKADRSLQSLSLNRLFRSFHVKNDYHQMKDQVGVPCLEFTSGFSIFIPHKHELGTMQYKIKAEYTYKVNPECSKPQPSDLYHQIKHQITTYFQQVHNRKVSIEKPLQHPEDCICTQCKKAEKFQEVISDSLVSAQQKYPLRFQHPSCILRRCSRTQCPCHQTSI